jgi:hypothetical protein
LTFPLRSNGRAEYKQGNTECGKANVGKADLKKAFGKKTIRFWYNARNSWKLTSYLSF